MQIHIGETFRCACLPSILEHKNLFKGRRTEPCHAGELSVTKSMWWLPSLRGPIYPSIYPILSYPVLSCPILSYFTSSYLFLSYLVLSYLTLSYLILPDLIISNLFICLTSYLFFLSYRISSYLPIYIPM